MRVLKAGISLSTSGSRDNRFPSIFNSRKWTSLPISAGITSNTFFIKFNETCKANMDRLTDLMPFSIPPETLVRFLDASSHLYKRVCPSVCPSVCPYVRPSVTIKEKSPKSLKKNQEMNHIQDIHRYFNKINRGRIVVLLDLLVSTLQI